MSNAQMAKNMNSNADLWDWENASEFVSSLPSRTYDEYLTKVITALYVLQPPVRLDYSNMIVYSRYTDRLKNDTTNNFAIFNNKDGFFFVLNNFKTKNSIGKFVSRKSKNKSQLHNILTVWFQEYNHSTYLLADEQGVPISKEVIAYRLKSAFQSMGLNIGIRQLRRIYETYLIHSPEYVGMTLAEKKDEHRQILHSFEMGHAYAIQSNESDVD
jgi:hypothetical protein